MKFSLLVAAGWLGTVSALAFELASGVEFVPGVAFNYGGVAYRTDKPIKVEKVANDAVCEITRKHYATPDGKLGISLTIKEYHDFPALEYLPELMALTADTTEIVDGLKSFDFAVPNTAAATVRTLRGSLCANIDFTPVSTYLAQQGGKTSVTYGAWGRSSDGANDGVVPFLGIDRAAMDGFELAIGWSGSWQADFTLADNALQVSGGLRSTHFRVLAGETLRAPSVLIWRRDNVTVQDFRTTIHRFMRDVKSPRDASGAIIPPILPLTTGGGNKSPNTMLRHIEWARENKMPFDAFWVDAGWNGPAHLPDQTTNCGNMWWNYAGTWTFNPTVHPAGNLAAVADSAHAAGMKMLLWVEPERVMPNSAVHVAHPEYCLTTGNPYLLNLGNPDACQWAIDTVLGLIEANHLDCYRQDFNIGNVQDYWKAADTAERVGVTEMKYIAGLYRFWDALRAKYPNILLENCASGGRRLDFELISRAHTYCRTDNAIGNKGAEQITSMQVITHNMLPYLPFQGSETRPANLNDDYSFFSTIATSGVFTPSDWGAFVSREPTAEETAWYKRTFEFVKERMTPYFMADYYQLVDNIDLNEGRICAWQFHDPQKNAGYVMVFRRTSAPGNQKIAFKALEGESLYRITHADNSQQLLLGAVLENYDLSYLKTARSFDVINYEKCATNVVPEFKDQKKKRGIKRCYNPVYQ